MGVMKPRRIDDKEKGKRALYSEGAVPGASKLSGVNKTFLLGALPYNTARRITPMSSFS